MSINELCRILKQQGIEAIKVHKPSGLSIESYKNGGISK